MKSLISYWSGADTRKRPKIQYEPDLRRVPQFLVDTYEALAADGETQRFLTGAKYPSLWRSLIASCLRPMFSRTTANGIAGRGGMFVFSTEQFQTLLGPSFRGPSERGGGRPTTLLDVGAGDGGVTAKMAPLFDAVDVTEDSFAMRWRLSQRGFRLLPVDSEFPPNHYDVVSCLNVLDRADEPLSLLQSLHQTVRQDGFVVLAVVLPWCPFVENGTAQKTPAQKLNMAGGQCCKGATFEQSLSILVERTIIPCGFRLVRWSKLPYLCEGSPTHEYYKLDDAVLLLQRSTCEALGSD